MTNITTQSTSARTAEILQDFIIEETPTTRRIFKAIIVDNPKDPLASVNGYIVYQRKSNKQQWEDVSQIKLNTLKAGEGVKFYFSCGELLKFYGILEEAYTVGNKGIKPGKKELVVTEADKIIQIESKRWEVIAELLKNDYGEDVWNELKDKKPDLATKLAYSKIQSDRQNALKEFEDSLKENKEESYWQKFFENNQWIFGYGLNYQFLHLLQGQPHYGGTSISGKGAQRGDYLMHTGADTKFTVLVEIKKPHTSLFGHNKEGKVLKYRNGVPLISGEITGAISQIQVNCNTWESEGSTLPQNQEELNHEKIFTNNPKGILVIGHTNQLDNFEKRKALELFRRSFHNPEIITFDELLERAKYIVGHLNEIVRPIQDNTETDDLPF